VRWALQAGFPLGVNMDLMYGLPGQRLEQWRQTLREAVALGPDHLSCYLLTLDERVPMGRDVARGRLSLPEDDEVAEMYSATRRDLAEAGYVQYEISNWARPGRECRHNLTYWRDQEWLGVGAGAASALNGRRWKNTPALERYIHSVERDGRAERVEDEPPSFATRLEDALSLGLRLREGLSLSGFRERFGVELIGTEAAWMLEAGFLERDGDRLRLAEEHQLIANEVLARLLRR
jgi:oxygen-independent coproporphyrinogen-3 oxidase